MRSLLLGFVLFMSACLPEDVTPTPTVDSHPPPATPSATYSFPTIIPTNTIIPTPSSTPTQSPFDRLGDVIYEDDFRVDRGWELGESQLGAISVQSARLVIALRQKNSFLYSLQPHLFLRDFSLEVDIRPDLCHSGDEFGVMFRVNNDFEHYRYAIDCQGRARVVRILSGESRSLVPRAEPPSLIAGPKSTNQLSLIASGSTLRFWINGFEVFSAADIEIEEGSIGLFVRSGQGNQVTVLFDNLMIREVRPHTPNLSTPTP